MADDTTTTTAPLGGHTEPNNSHQEESSGVTINHHLWLAWTLTRLWDARHLPAIKRIVDDHLNVDDNDAARGFLWSLTSRKHRDLQAGALGHTILPDHPSAPDYITSHLPTWLADFRRGPRGRQGPVLAQESESQRRARLRSIPSPAAEPRDRVDGSTLLDMERVEIPPVLPASDAPKQLPPVEPLTLPPRLNNRKFTKLLEKSPVLPEVIQPILSLYDFEIPSNQQSPAVLDDVEKLLGYVDWPWWNYADRGYMINYKVTAILYRLLRLHGYRQFSTTTIDGKARLKISPNQGMTASPLPAWLTTPYLVLVQSQDFTIIPEGCRNPAITSGDTISDSFGRNVGIFDPNHELMWICPTAGHLIYERE